MLCDWLLHVINRRAGAVAEVIKKLFTITYIFKQHLRNFSDLVTENHETINLSCLLRLKMKLENYDWKCFC